MPDNKKGMNDPSLRTFIANNGIQPTGDVLRIMKPIEIKAVNTTVFKVNLSF